MLIGNLGADPEQKAMPSGTAVTNFRVATSESWKDKNTGEKQERTEWHSIATFGRLAEVCGSYLRKGSKVYIEGKLRTRKWQDRDGKDRWTTEIIGDKMQMLDSKGSGQGQGGQIPDSARGQQPAEQPAPAPQGSPPAGEFDDDIPF